MRWRLALLALVAQPAAAQDAVFQPIAPTIVDIQQTGTPLTLGDDNTRQVDLGFTFDFFGQQYTSAWVSSNGFISFDNVGHLCCNGAPISQTPKNGIYALWTDLVSFTGSPYVKSLTSSDGIKSFLAGWYATSEYGSNRFNTFEIQLFDGGSIEIRYGDVGNIYHQVSAGIAGPANSDRYSLFFGTQVDVLDNTAWRYGTKAAKVDCATTPLDPSCPPPVVTPVTIAIEPVATMAIAEPVAAAQEAVVDTPAAEAAADVAEAEPVSDTPAAAETSQEAATAAAEASPAEETTTSEKTTETAAAGDASTSSPEAGPPPPLSPSVAGVQTGEVAAGAWASPFGFSAPVATATVTGSDADQSSPVVRSRSESSSASAMAVLEALSTASSSASAPAQVQTSTSSSDTGAQLGGNQDATASEMAATPAGFSQYAGARLADRPFYPPVQIYGRRRPVDAYLVLYRLLMTNDQVFDRMVDEQYGRR